jgi:hypothetical protein
MPRTLRVLNVLTAVVSLASGAAVLLSNVLDPGYRAHFADPLWLVVVYLAFYVWVFWAFLRATPAAPWLGLAKALGAYVFLVVVAVVPWLALHDAAPSQGLGSFLFLNAFTTLTREWVARTPGRYVYQLADWGPGAATVFVAFVFLGRGAWNTANALTLTRDWWLGLRARAPLVGRLVTAVPVALLVFSFWGFFLVARLENTTSSPEADEVARTVADDLACDDIRAKTGTTTTDVRARGERRFEVLVRWGCPTSVVLVRTPDDKVGSASATRAECCGS